MITIHHYHHKSTLQLFASKHFRHFSSKGQVRKVITTPIFYVNATPHIGHLYTAIYCDAIARYHRINGDEVLFSTGTDEHGIKIQKKAIEASTDPKLFCDNNAQKFKELFKIAQISYDRFIRTTDSDHAIAVNHFWKTLQNNGYIKEGKHEGYYSVNEESFIAEKDLLKKKDGSYCTENGEVLELISEKNYIFEMREELKKKIRQWMEENVDGGDRVLPEQIRNRVINELEAMKEGISVSRPRDRLNWGIQVPEDPSQTIYVWLDALVNYITVLGYPNKFKHEEIAEMIHIVGKDISKFHCIYWPAFLISANLPLPKQVINHGHWLKNKVCQVHLINLNLCRQKCQKAWETLLTHLTLLMNLEQTQQDHTSQAKDHKFMIKTLKSNCSSTIITKSYATSIVKFSSLILSLVNLLFRITGKKILKDRNVIDALGENQMKFINRTEIDCINELSKKIQNLYRCYDFFNAFELIQEILRIGNGVLTTSQFWTIQDQSHLDFILYFTLELIRLVSILMQPYTPDLASKMLDYLNIEDRILNTAFIDNFDRQYKLNLEVKDSIFISKIETQNEQETTTKSKQQSKGIKKGQKQPKQK